VLKEVLVWVQDPWGFVKMLEKKGKPWLAGPHRDNENTCCFVLVDFLEASWDQAEGWEYIKIKSIPI